MRKSGSCYSGLEGAEVTNTVIVPWENRGGKPLLVTSLFPFFPSLGFGLLEPAFPVAEGQWDGAKVLLLSEPPGSEEQ